MKYGELSLGQIEAVVNKLGGMDGVYRLLAEQCEVVGKKKPIIGCDTVPFTPMGWKIQSHRKHKQFCWNPDNVSLWLADAQRIGPVQGNELERQLREKATFNAAVLDYLLGNRDLIPQNWKGKLIFFWGTIYLNCDGQPCVRCLLWSDGRWCQSWHRLQGSWFADAPAALRTA